MNQKKHPWNKGLSGKEYTSHYKNGYPKGHWKGGRWKNNKGYILILIDNTHPFLKMAIRRMLSYYIYEHRLVMAQYLNRCLEVWEYVHHINSIKDDNKIENLVIVTKAQHSGLQAYLAELWVKEHPNTVEKVTRNYIANNKSAPVGHIMQT